MRAHGVQDGASDDAARAEALARLTREDALGQLWRRDGVMARLGSEGDALKLDWVGAVPWLLAHPDALAGVQGEARALQRRGVRHVIWAGMGGSVLTVRVLHALGYGAAEHLTIHPLDSTDPAALNGIVRALATSKGIVLSPSSDLLQERDLLCTLLGDVALVAVAMGMTSEEPISHLAWFATALEAAGLPLADHAMTMALPGSYLDTWAAERDVPRLPLQLDGGSGTGGRMSAPGTRVFLLPAALWLAAQEATAQTSPLADDNDSALPGILRRAWEAYRFDAALAQPDGNQYVRLAAALSAASVQGAVRLRIEAPGAWSSVRDWAEQLFEESLGKGGKGVVIFADEGRHASAPNGSEHAASGEIRMRITGDDATEEAPDVFTLREPLISSADLRERLAGLAALFLGLQLTMALYGYLHDITFAGQPAVEDYKARARALRDSIGDALPSARLDNSVTADGWTLFAPPSLNSAARGASPRAALVASLVGALRDLPAMRPLPYLDVTVNGEAPADALATLDDRLRRLAVERLGVPYKLRRAPAAYHSTEQSEMDGPPALVSLRTLALRQEPSLLGEYSPRFLRAQAVATWQAMLGVGRACLLLLYDGDARDMTRSLAKLLGDVAQELPAT